MEVENQTKAFHLDNQGLVGLSEVLLRALAAHDPVYDGRADRVNDLAWGVAVEMRASQPNLEVIRTIGRLYDIGRLGLPPTIMTKTEGFNDADHVMVRWHPMLGERILTPLKLDLFELTPIKYHHERWDGSGYPYRLKGVSIPVLGRIYGVVDAFCAMTSPASYRKDPMTVQQAIQELEAGSGKQFDPQVVDAMLHFHHKRQSRTAPPAAAA